MDMADAFHRGAPEELSKTDFFDFVVSPDAGVDGQLSLNRTLKSMGIFIDGPAPSNASAELPHSYKLVDEQNNNLVSLPTDDAGNFVEHAFWASSCDKETVRIESEILEDLNKFCWTQDGDLLGGQRGDAIADTDGAIYTLTVLNGDHSTATWYRGGGVGKDDGQATGQATLDLDSILSIIPTGEHYQENFDASLTALGGDKPDYATAFDDSGYATKDASFANNNNISNNNNNNSEWKNHNDAADDSLLRSALQGLSRYAPTQKKDDGLVPLEGALFVEAAPDPLLSTLDADSLPGDYETLKRIAREVAESAGRFCLDTPTAFAPAQEAVASPAPARKKASRAKGVAKMVTHAPTAVAVAVSSGGARKERSLHHCSICSKGFKDKYSVNVHIRTHTGEKPFACSLCGKSFRQKAHLAKHYQTHIAQKHAAAAAAAGGGTAPSAKGGHKRFAKSS